MDKERQERQVEAVRKAKEYIQKLFNDNADGHDCMHALRVYQNALKIAEGYPKCSLFIVSMASLLHDADDHKLFHTKNNENARTPEGSLRSRPLK